MCVGAGAALYLHHHGALMIFDLFVPPKHLRETRLDVWPALPLRIQDDITKKRVDSIN